MNTTTKPDASEIVHHDGGTTFAGKDAVNLFRAATLMSALKFYAKTGMKVTRNVSPGDMLKLANQYTGKTYKRGQYAEAAEGVRVWIETMKAALPITDERSTYVDRAEFSNLKMAAGNEKKYTHVIDDGELKCWVGIGWVTERKATAEDRAKYPTARDPS